MYICYVDEAGCTGELPGADSSIQPVFVLSALMVPQANLARLTHDWLLIKQRYFPGLLPAGAFYYDWMKAEVKGADLRRMARSTSRNQRRFVYRVIAEVVALLEKHDVRICGKVFVKGIGARFSGPAVYSSTVQLISTTFQQLLEEHGAHGFMIADSRNKALNTNVAHSIFTQMYRLGHNPYSRLLEIPTFGHSDNHTGLQLADLVCSGLLFPIASEVCCSAHLNDQTHCSPHYLNLKARYGEALKGVQYRYQEALTGRWMGGIVLADPLNHRNAMCLFR